MRIAHISTYDIEGGAGRAAYRLHKGLQSIDVNSRMLVQYKTSQDSTVTGSQGLPGIAINKLCTYLDLLPLKFYPNRQQSSWGVSWAPSNIHGSIEGIAPDLVHLHWICCGFVPVTALRKFNRPLVWTMHDSWAFTGGCNLPGKCMRYCNSCGACPQLGSKRDYDLTRWEWNLKAKSWQGLNLTIVAPSHWMGDCVKASSLFREARVEVIPNGLDLSRYKQVNKGVARELLGLPQDKKLILFGATIVGDHNKGFHHLKSALQVVADGWSEKAELLVFGASQPADLSDIPLPVHCLGKLHDDISLTLAYAAADVMCVPSMQESFGQTASEAMACGTPVVAFASTGLLDIVVHEQTGYLAHSFDTNDFARGIDWVLADDTRRERLCRMSREKVEKEFAMDGVAKRYADLYQEIIDDV
ncbi:glycosyltransferase family 4 protein [Geotalea uraniireducens]|uniref:Glycosyl transferase, group 1 n=1 Tax=Geotalea uraniireducens (strain Rf4) TaxID=351605 RepID=A5G815_GEOUR|nr:glycosyltransferase family 4 protein [Geotalea uraniireducens]ABQ27933.1 glycosyl transferase, group 1 [Geotalea uraniireducens Rf4]